ncbi:MAG: formylglycine-generating enzyme family protein, partial [Gammaproteobacteria bacterium]|nr:formylglycine-generating enzyme family protein [Gammaproteobacteria bacterium]
LTLPVMRLVQQRMAPGPQSELAEVFLSSLIRPRDSAVVDPMLREYDFYGNLRDRLLNTIDAPATLQVLLHVSRYLSEHLGNAIDFQALLRDPDAASDLRLDEDARHFAEISALVLKRFGGKYLQAAKVLSKKSSSFPIPEMVSLPGGTFIMGDDKSIWESEKPAHPVTLSPFSIGKYQITFEEYDRFCEAVQRKKPEDRGWGRGKRPVIDVSWDDAAAYCEWLSEQTGKQYRLPTEAEWEYACRSGSETAYCFGEDEERLSEYAWYGGGSTHPVGQKKPNAFGLYDMHGNVWEWCADWFGSYLDGPVIDPMGSDSGSDRVMRGGSWDYGGQGARSASHIRYSPVFRYMNLGFRIARGQKNPAGKEKGCQTDEAERVSQASQRIRKKPEWADSLGEDDYGVFADFSFQGVIQRMRRIEPGRFMMGSLKTETGRWNDEGSRHEVILTRGFWLADTACTQKLWQAVTGKNPSYFKGDEKPVEQVSWNDVTAFILQLNEKMPGLKLRLPTEAEWEYACRAGTDTPFWFGNNITPEQVNYDGNYPYAGGKKGLHRGKTVEVKALPCNAWGLYQMHGNVREWCADWFGDYPNGPVTGPAGSDSGSYRVVRGGSWANDGRYTRSAYRLRLSPAYRSISLGFRFTRGQ